MARKARIDAPEALHHVIVRGIERGNIFRSDYDRENFLNRLRELIPETRTDCFAWALIPKHMHLLLRSDGCSCWPDNEWIDCCVEHDDSYWMGGTREERKKADIALRECVSRKGHPYIGKIMYYGVRVGGVYWLPTSFRWGFGWSYPQSGPPNKKY